MSESSQPAKVGSNVGLGVMASGAPRVEACIEAVMAKHPTIGGRADTRYFEAVHQELAPLARELERLADSEGTRAVEYLRRARKAEAALAATRGALSNLLLEPYGCQLCDSGVPRDNSKGHQPECPYVRAVEAMDAADAVLTPNAAVTGRARSAKVRVD